MKKLPNKINETFEEGCERKAKVLDIAYTQLQEAQSYPGPCSHILDAAIKLIEAINYNSVREE